MRATRGLFLLLLPALFALADGGKSKCETCHGEKQVKCFGLGGHATVEVDCPLCQGTGGAACTSCKGTTKLDCVACRGSGKIQSLGCRVCNGSGKIACKLCDGGKVPCTLCKGKKVLAQPCLVCSGRGKLPCPDCGKPEDSCPVCEGKKTEKCPVCLGAGELPAPCPGCKGLRYEPCMVCGMLGFVPCTQCSGEGSTVTQDKHGDWKLGKQCQACHGAGGKSCDACKGKCGTPCKACNGKGSVTAKCWFCDGAKTIPCRRCVQGIRWTGAEPTSAAFFSVYPCDAVEPQVEKGVKLLAPSTNYAAYRIIIDTRNAKGPITLGLADWMVALTTTDGGEAMLSDATSLPDEAHKALEKRMPIWGMPAEACHAGGAYAQGTVSVHLALVDRETAKKVKGFRLKSMRDALVTVDLKASSLDVAEWLKDCTAAAAKAGK